MSKLNKITMGTIIVIILVGFISNSMGPFNAGLTVLGSYLIIHGSYIHFKGEDFYKILELGMDPQEFNYVYQGNGKYVQPESGKNIQFFDGNEQTRFTQGIESMKPDFKLYGITLIIAVVLMSFSVTKMSDEVLYDHAVGILEDEFVNDPDYSHVDIQITYPNIKDVEFIDLDKGFKAVTGQFRDRFGDYANFTVAIKGSNSKIKDYWWTVEYKGMEQQSW